MKRLQLSLTLGVAGICMILAGFGVYLTALQSDIRTPNSTYSVTIEYANTTSQDTTLYIAGAVENALSQVSLASGSTLEVSKIEHTFPMQYSQSKGLSNISSGNSSTKTASVNPLDATFVNSQNQLSFVLTPNLDNRCATLEGIKGCVWDGQKLNQFSSDTLSCFGADTYVCENDVFNSIATNQVGAGLGGKFVLTFRIKGSIDKEQLAYFPLKTFQYTPASVIKRSPNLSSGLSLILTDRAVASFSSVVNTSSAPSSSSSASSVVSSNPVSSSSVSSTPSSSASSSSLVVSTTPLTRTDVPLLDIFCKDGVVGQTTTCSFTLPANKSLPSSLRISVGAGTSVGCTAVLSDVTCPLVPLPIVVGKASIFVTISTEKIDSGKKVGVVAQVGDLVRTGAFDTIIIVAFIVFTVTLGAVAYSASKRASIKKLDL